MKLVRNPVQFCCSTGGKNKIASSSCQLLMFGSKNWCQFASLLPPTSAGCSSRRYYCTENSASIFTKDKLRATVQATIRAKLTVHLHPNLGSSTHTHDVSNRLSHSTNNQSFVRSLQTTAAAASSSDLESHNQSGPKESAKSEPAAKSKARVFLSINPRSSRVRDKEQCKMDAQEAFSKYGLNAKQLEGLAFKMRRSSYLGEPEVKVYFEEDVKNEAETIYGKKQLKFMMGSGFLTSAASNSNYGRQWQSDERKIEARKNMKTGGTGHTVVTAVLMNFCDACLKYGAFFFTGSSTMFAEAMHATCDTLNQGVLYYGVMKGAKPPDAAHPYGYGQMRYVTSLMAGCGIFFMGCGVTVYHGVESLIFPHEMDSVLPAMAVLTVSFMLQGKSFYTAFRQTTKDAAKYNMTTIEYIRTGMNPTSNVILMEDFVTLSGICIAFSSIGASVFLGMPAFDAVGSILIGAMMGCTGTYIIRSNAALLVGKSLSDSEQQKMMAFIEHDPIVISAHDVKTTRMGPGNIKYKTEIYFNGHEIAYIYMKQNEREVTDMLQRLAYCSDRVSKELILSEFGSGVVDQLGAEVDRLEIDLKKKFPEMRHIDIEPV